MNLVLWIRSNVITLALRLEYLAAHALVSSWLVRGVAS